MPVDQSKNLRIRTKVKCIDEQIDGFDGKTAVINGRWEKSIDEIVQYFETIGIKGYLLQRPLFANESCFQ